MSSSIALHSNSICGILRFGANIKVSLYADDLLLFVSDLSVSVAAAHSTLQTFGQISGYELNLHLYLWRLWFMDPSTPLYLYEWQIFFLRILGKYGCNLTVLWISNIFHPLSPLADNHVFPLVLLDSSLRQWSKLGISCIKDM